MAEFIRINLNDMIDSLGENKVKSILSSFSCPLNKDVEDFLIYKAVEFSKRGFSKTHLVFWLSSDGKEKELIGYFTIASKVIRVKKDILSKSMAKKMNEHGDYDPQTGEYIVPAPLIGQLGKNYLNGNDTLISGDELLQMAIDKIKEIQNEIGGKFAYLECEDKPQLLNFYTRNNFFIFGNRPLDKDETNIVGNYLVQLLLKL